VGSSSLGLFLLPGVLDMAARLFAQHITPLGFWLFSKSKATRVNPRCPAFTASLNVLSIGNNQHRFLNSVHFDDYRNVMSTASLQVEKLFRQLHSHIEAEDEDKVLEVANSILKLSPSDDDAISAKTTALIHKSLFEEALEAANTAGAKKLLFEKAYCYYRLNKLEDALKALDEIPESKRSTSTSHVKAQVVCVIVLLCVF